MCTKLYHKLLCCSHASCSYASYASHASYAYVYANVWWTRMRSICHASRNACNASCSAYFSLWLRPRCISQPVWLWWSLWSCANGSYDGTCRHGWTNGTFRTSGCPRNDRLDWSSWTTWTNGTNGTNGCSSSPTTSMPSSLFTLVDNCHFSKTPSSSYELSIAMSSHKLLFTSTRPRPTFSRRYVRWM